MLALKGIVGRVERHGRIYRQLECGHEQAEPPGGRSPMATHAQCGICNGPRASEVIGSCTALVLPLNCGKARPCGKPAKHLKRGQPRCGYHFNRGVR